MRLKSIMKAGFALTCVLSLVCIPFVNAFAAYEPAKAPRINSFTVSKTTVNLGETVILKWNTLNAVQVEITGIEKTIEGQLPVSGTIEVLPMATTTYTLIAKGYGGTSYRTLTVYVGNCQGKVTVDCFKSSKTQVTAGETIILSWKTTNAVSVSIIGLEKEPEDKLLLDGSLEVLPTATTTYTLRAVGANDNTASKSLTVTVVPPQSKLQIKSFKASATTVIKGQMVTLSWTTSNASGCKLVISDGITVINRPANGSLSITPNKTKSYTLEAYNAKGDTVRKTITIIVKY
jgi:hypothetical protein